MAVRSHTDAFPSILEGLKTIYRTKIEPVECASAFEQFYSSRLTSSDLDARPMVLLLGQYSTGKTTFINHLLAGAYPGAHIGPEPTTDKFVAVMSGDCERTLPGNAATVQSSLPFAGLAHFGTSFLAKFNVAFTAAPLAELLTLIDTPGVLSGDKQRLGRSYDYGKVVEWLAQRADMILLLFDAHKLDISDEFRNVIHALRGHDDKIRVVLNKADSITTQQLMRVYGALMWSLGKVVNTPEVMRVYVGSFWTPPADFAAQNCDLIATEHADLLRDLHSLPRQSAMRKVNELVKRARLARVHAHIIESLRREMPTFFGRSAKQNKLICNLADEFTRVQKLHNLPPGDFPDIEAFQACLRTLNLATFPKLSTRTMAALDEALAVDLPALLAAFPQDMASFSPHVPRNPFTLEALETASSDDIWTIRADRRAHYQHIFRSICTQDRLTGTQAKAFLADSSLSADELAHIWRLADGDQDGHLTQQEFAIAMHLIHLTLRHIPLPETLSISHCQ